MDQESSQSLSDRLLALPKWARITTIGLLIAGVSLGFVLLLIPLGGDEFRSAGAEILTVSLPVLAIGVGLFGATSESTAHIDALIARFLRRTIAGKLDHYLVGPAIAEDHPIKIYPPLFSRMEILQRDAMTSYCGYRFHDDADRRFDLYVKSNVFNFEFGYALHLSHDTDLDARTRSLTVKPGDDWSKVSDHPLVRFAPGSLYGSLAEGYTLYIEAVQGADGVNRVAYRLRQRTERDLLTSPFVRRYFAEDVAIAAYFFFAEALPYGNDRILDGALW
jgi:hypothetical protein